jgi:hypothetical protein
MTDHALRPDGAGFCLTGGELTAVGVFGQSVVTWTACGQTTTERFCRCGHSR